MGGLAHKRHSFHRVKSYGHSLKLHMPVLGKKKVNIGVSLWPVSSNTLLLHAAMHFSHSEREKKNQLP